MNIDQHLPGLAQLAAAPGNSRVCVAVLDGPVDVSHECFAGADLAFASTLVDPTASSGSMSRHGTHMASIIFGQPGTSVPGIAPGCRGLLVPVFPEPENGRLRQLDLSRAIEQAVAGGAHVINISGGELTNDGEVDPLLEKALATCRDQNVLVVAATGNDGCECLHVPAALESVLAVGALARDGTPLSCSNWGDQYREHGVVAIGDGIPGALPGGGISHLTGTSPATAVVSGVAALLLSRESARHGRIDPHHVARVILRTADRCDSRLLPGCDRYLSGSLNARRASAHLDNEGTTRMSETEFIDADPVAIGPVGASPLVGASTSADTAGGAAIAPAAGVGAGADEGAGLRAAGGCGCGGIDSCGCGATVAATGAAPAVPAVPAIPTAPAVPTVVTTVPTSYVYALGTIGFDFGTEARRDTFRQSMPDIAREIDGNDVFIAPNPYDVFQLSDYLDGRPSESTKLIWTLNLDLTPIYALEAEAAYPEDVYSTLRGALRREALPAEDADHVSRLSVPGVVTNRTVRLFSGQVLPVVLVQPRGLFEWNEPTLVTSVIESVTKGRRDLDVDRLSQLIRIFLDKVYFECRNLGLGPADRALNFAATNAFQFASGIVNGILSGRLVPNGNEALYTLDSIRVAKSPYCRMDSDCWDVLITWFDPENQLRARSVFQFTIDVSDELPVSLAPAHQYLTT